MCGAEPPPASGQPALDQTSTLPAGRKTAVRAVYAALFFSCVGGAAVVPVIPFHARSLGASPAMVGYMFSAWSAAEIAGTPVAAWAMDRYGRRPVLLASLALHSLAAGIAGSATGLEVLLVSRFLAGFGSSGGTVYQVILTDLLPKDLQAAALARLAAVPPAAMLCGPLLGGYIAQNSTSFTFYTEAMLKAMTFLLVAAWVPNRKIEIDTSKDKRAPVPFSANVLGLASFLTGVFVGTAISMLAVTLEQRYGYSQLETSYFITVRSGIMLVVSFAVTPVLQRVFGVLASAVGGTLFAALMICGFAVTDHAFLALAFFAASAAGSAVRLGCNGELCARLSDETNRGAVFGRVVLFGSIGGLTGPVLAGHLANIGERVPWLVSSAACGLSGLVLLLQNPGRAKSAGLVELAEPLGEGKVSAAA